MIAQYVAVVKKKVSQMDVRLEESKKEVDYYKRRFEESVGELTVAINYQVAPRCREHNEHEVWDNHYSKPRAH